MAWQSRHAARINTVIAIMAISARLHAGVNAVVKYTAEIETGDVMANITINGHGRMAYGLSCRNSAVVAACTITRDVGVVDVGILEIVRVMTGAAINIGNKMALILTNGNSAVVTRVTSPDNIGMIVAAIWPKH